MPLHRFDPVPGMRTPFSGRTGRADIRIALVFPISIPVCGAVFQGDVYKRQLECIEYYGGTTQGVAAVFSALKQVGDIPVISLFSPEDIPGYVTSLVKDCPMCKAGQKIDAVSYTHLDVYKRQSENPPQAPPFSELLAPVDTKKPLV